MQLCARAPCAAAACAAADHELLRRTRPRDFAATLRESRRSLPIWVIKKGREKNWTIFYFFEACVMTAEEEEE